MGGCCGAMKTGQKSLPENKHQKVDSENKQIEKDAQVSANNKATEAVNETVKLNHGDNNTPIEVKHETTKVANGLDQKDPASNPVVAVTCNGENEITVEEEVATKIVTQAMEAALAETNGPSTLEPQTSVTGSAGGVSDEEALNEWMKADTRNTLVIDEPALESATQIEVLSAAVDVPNESTVQPGDVDVTVQAENDVIPEYVTSPVESKLADEITKPEETDVELKVHTEEQAVADEIAVQNLQPVEEVFVSGNAAGTLEQNFSEPLTSSEVNSLTNAEPQTTEFVEEQLESPKLENLPPPDLSPEVHETENQAPENVGAVPSEIPEPGDFSAAETTNTVPELTDNANITPESTVISSDNIDVPAETVGELNDDTLLSHQDVPPVENIESSQEPHAEDFDVENLPPPPAQEFTDEAVLSSPDFPELPVLEAAPLPEESLPQDFQQEQQLSETVDQSEAVDAPAPPSKDVIEDHKSEEQPTTSEGPESEVVPVLEEVVEQASELRNEWWNGSQPEEEQTPSIPVNGTSEGMNENSIHNESSAVADEHAEGSIPILDQNGSFDQEIALNSAPHKAALQDNLVPSVETKINDVEQESTEAAVSAQA